MSAVLHLITPVGTSLYTNYLNPGISRTLEYVPLINQEQRKIALLQRFDHSLDGKRVLYQRKTKRGAWVTDDRRNEQNAGLERQVSDDLFARWALGVEKDMTESIPRYEKRSDADYVNVHASAEIQTIYYLLYHRLNAGEEFSEVKVHLLSTDTALSRLCGEVLVKALNALSEREIQGVRMPKITALNPMKINGLQVMDVNSFENYGFHNLVRKIRDVRDQAVRQNDQLVIILSGGYKSLIPPTTLVAQLYGISCVYLYEQSTEVFELPVVPISFDINTIEQYFPHFLHSTEENGKIKYGYSRQYLEEQDADGHIRDQLAFLVSQRLFHVKNPNKPNEFYQASPLGLILKHTMQDRSHIGTKTLGFVAEYKLFEYLHKHQHGLYGPEPSPILQIDPSWVLEMNHQVSLPEFNQIHELDIAIWEGGFLRCYIEVKSLAQLFAVRKDASGEVSRFLPDRLNHAQKRHFLFKLEQLKASKAIKLSPDFEFHLCAWRMHFGFGHLRDMKRDLFALADEITNGMGMGFKAYYFEANPSTRYADTNDFQAFLINDIRPSLEKRTAKGQLDHLIYPNATS